MRQYIGSTLFQVMPCGLFGAKALPEPMLAYCQLTHWGRVTHICVGKLTIIGSDNGLSPGRRQAIIWTNAGILLIGPLGTNFSEILIAIETVSFKKKHLKMSSGKCRPFCLGLNVLMDSWNNIQWTSNRNSVIFIHLKLSSAKMAAMALISFSVYAACSWFRASITTIWFYWPHLSCLFDIRMINSVPNTRHDMFFIAFVSAVLYKKQHVGNSDVWKV